ncbi:glycosaminoglycan xylosylkinase [Elysia marginata]|uniref:Glycosaminoglycan xylosylkinase n=1 Tax=Elysia marginata TaxID=1093978 RepID=A0AAV4HAF3_9GAST|nr:glycosaminoglycan xylosylkinase [Elysia marginata]
MHQGQITQADVGHKGTQLKLMLVLDNEQKVVFKPAWYSRDYVVEGPPYAGRDRHNAEIAAFHLGRILELRRSPLVVGRKVNLLKDIFPVASDRLKETFFRKDKAPCFYGRCHYCKGPEDGVCAGSDGILEGVLVLWIPEHYHLKLHRHPWARTYREGKMARWETDDTYCAKVRAVPGYSQGPRLLDIVDTAVLDFLVGNADRHHYETIQEGGRDAALIILDNGKRIRASLWQRLLALQEGVLSHVLASILDQDPVAPVLTQPHLTALDRRLGKVLDQVGTCVDRVGIKAIVLDGNSRKDSGDSGIS